MKKLLLLSVLVIFSCSGGDDSSYSNNDNDDNNNNFSCDGVPYDSIVYGAQEWTVENACHITYRDGTPIPEVTDPTQWSNLTTGAWSYYNNDPTKPRLYNWYAVMGKHDNDPNTPNKEFAPEGWHVTTDTEWTTLEEYLIANGYNYDGSTAITQSKLAKALASNTGWLEPTDPNQISIGAPSYNQSTNNSSGFNAFPVGVRHEAGSFNFSSSLSEGMGTRYWTSTSQDWGRAWSRNFVWLNEYLIRSEHGKDNGYSVRLVRD